MNNTQALQYLLILTQTLALAGAHVKNLASHLAQAQSEGRDLTDDEVAQFKSAAEEARSNLLATLNSLDVESNTGPVS